MQTLAVVHRADAILIVEHGRHGLVLILQLRHLRGNDLPFFVGGDVAALHPVVVHRVVGLLPRQHHRALLRLGLQRVRDDLAQTLVVEKA